MAYSKRLIPQTIRTLAFGSITGTFANLGTALSKPAVILHLKNTSNQTAEISVDGTNVNFSLPSNSFDLYDISANHSGMEAGFLREGIQLQARRPSTESNPTSGAVICQIWVEDQ